VNLKRRLEQHARWIDTLAELSAFIAGENDLRDTLDEALRGLAESLAFAFGGVSLVDGERGEELVACLHTHDPWLASWLGLGGGTAMPAGWSQRVSSLPAGRVSQLATVDLEAFSKAKAAGLNCAVLLPLAAGAERLGTLFMLFREPLSLEPGQRGFLAALAAQLGLAVRQRELARELQASRRTMMEQERLNAMGQMAGGIVHDINNTLAPIALYSAALLEGESGLSERARGYLQTIRQAAGDIEATTSRMREFYRKREESAALQPIDLRELLGQVAELTRPRWADMPNRHGLVVDLRLEAPEAIPALAGVPGEIREALMNLVFNAVDALPQGGSIRLRAAVQEPFLVIEVADTGLGMDEEQKARCLEPFYTTKGANGTGLGLAIVYGVMQRHGGEIRIESSPGRGTIVRLLFPRRTLEPAPEAAGRAPARQEALRILFIDDEPMVLNTMQELLRAGGHRVTGLSGGEDAVRRFRAEQAEGRGYDVVITDLSMPNMDGIQVAREIKRASPRTPVILLSGWGSFSDGGEKPEWVDQVISKPPTMNDLRAALRRLAAPAAPTG
jgi:signal transduction histidine kinase/CheY-like chemotaxis protein